MPLTVMTYNIKTGGRGRLAAITRVIAAQRPDILALQELRFFHRAGRRLMDQLADEVGMHAYLARSCWGQPVAVLVRDRAPVLSAGPVRRPLHHAAARVVLRTDRGRLSVIGTHLYPYSGGRRQREARWLTTDSDPSGLTLLMGDLNTLDPWTDHTERLRRLPDRYRSRHVIARRPDQVDSRAIQVLQSAGLVDLFHSLRQGAPAAAGETDHTAPTGYGGSEFSGMRLDYIFASPPVAALTSSCRIVTGAETEYASDHYPVVAVLDLNLRPA